MSAAPFILLSSEEEVTLRRVAFGESPASTLRAQDLSRLRRLRLIDEAAEPRLTRSGRVHFEGLPKAAMMGKRDGRSLGEEIERLQGALPGRANEARRPASAGATPGGRASPGKDSRS